MARSQAARRSLLLASARLGIDDTRVSVATAMLGWTPASLGRGRAHARGHRERLPGRAGPAARRARDRRALARLQLGCVGLADAGEGLRPGRLLRSARGRSPAPQPAPEVPGLRRVGAAARRQPRDAPTRGGRASRLGTARARLCRLAAGRRAQGGRSGGCRAGGRGRSEVARRAGRRDRPRLRQGQPSRPRSARLGALIKSNPQAREPGLPPRRCLLLWIKRNALAQQEFAKAVKLDPRGRIGRVAQAFLTPLRKSGGEGPIFSDQRRSSFRGAPAPCDPAV